MVYVVQDQAGKNLLPAKEYGELKFMLPGSLSQFDVQRSIKKLRKDLAHITKDDYLLLIGDPVMIGAAISLAASVNDGYVRVLKWDKQEKKYYDVEITL